MGQDSRMTPTEPESPTDIPPRTHTTVAWLGVALNIAYAIYGYYGFAPPPEGMPTDWWHGRTYILDYESMGGFVDDPLTGALLFGIPAALLCVVTFATTRSATARVLSLGATFTALLFAAGGFAAASPWVLFSWRFTAVLAGIGFSVALAFTAPILVDRWLRYSLPVRIAIYLPIFFVVAAAVRGATGTSEKMQFMVSPWPILTTYGLQTLALLVSVVLFAAAVGLASLSSKPFGFASALGLLVAAAIPVGWVAFAGTQLPIDTGLIPGLIAIGIAGLCFVYPGKPGKEDARTLGLRRTYHIGLGALLTFVPIFTGQALARGDYVSNRYVRAPIVIDALQRHIKTEESYPPSLASLVDAGYLDETPRPRIGFRILESLGLADEVKYRYNEYGSSFILEFDASLWTQCSYSGNYYFDEEEEEELEDEDAPAWSCLNKSPALFGDGEPPEPDDDMGDGDEY